MSFKVKIAAAAATFALAGGGLGMLGTLGASAATTSCGPKCQDLYTQKFGPRYLLDTFDDRAAANQKIVLYRASNHDPAQDFTIKVLGSVDSFYGHHQSLITPQFDTRYGALSAYELEYAPYGVNSNLCVGTWPGQLAQAGFRVRLEPCGLHRNVAWAIFTGQNLGDHVTPGYAILISVATNSLTHPLVLNYPVGNPAGRPSPWLNVQPLRAYADGTIFNNQQWAYRNGPAM